jgi:hypothetical protein
MDPFINQLAALCSTYVTRAKWVFVPTHSLGDMVAVCQAAARHPEWCPIQPRVEESS